MFVLEALLNPFLIPVIAASIIIVIALFFIIKTATAPRRTEEIERLTEDCNYQAAIKLGKKLINKKEQRSCNGMIIHGNTMTATSCTNWKLHLGCSKKNHHPLTYPTPLPPPFSLFIYNENAILYIERGWGNSINLIID